MPEFSIDNQPIRLTTDAHSRKSVSPAVYITEWQAVEFRCIPPPDSTLLLILDGPAHSIQLSPFLHPGDPAWYWRWNPKNIVGHFLLTLRAVTPAGSMTEYYATIAVIPGKLDQQHYQTLLADVQRLSRVLVYALGHSSAGAALHPHPDHDRQQHTWFEDFCTFCDERLTTLEQLVRRIARHPQTPLRQESLRIPLEQAHTLADADVSRIENSATYGQTDGTSLPTEITQKHTVATTNTYEHQLLKRVLDEYWRRVDALRDVALDTTRYQHHSPPEHLAHIITERSQTIIRRLHTLRMLPFLADVPPLHHFHGPSHLMRHHADYRSVYRLWQELRASPLLTVESPAFHMPIQSLPRLYEYWCALHLVHALLQVPGTHIHTQQLCTPVAPDTPAYRITLTEDAPLLTLDMGNVQLRLRYQPRYRPIQPDQHTTPGSLDAHTHIPDFVIECTHVEQPPDILIFDAKYRLDAGGGLPTDALADAYTYLGGIGFASGRRATRNAVLLYPGHGSAAHYAGGISMFPLLPDTTIHFQTWLIQKVQTCYNNM